MWQNSKTLIFTTPNSKWDKTQQKKLGIKQNSECDKNLKLKM